MNLIDAVKSGRSFKRKSYDEDMWCHVVNNSDGCDEIEFMTGHCKTFMAYVEDLTADDWEIREPVVTITRTQLANAISAYIAAEKTASNFFEPAGNIYPDPVNFIARKLGLED